MTGPKQPLRWRETVQAALEALKAHPMRTLLTSASMAAAVLSVALVTCIAATVSTFVLDQIRGIGSNLVFAYYEAGGNVSATEADYIDLADVEAVRTRLGSLAGAVAGVTSTWDTIAIDGQPTQVRILGSSETYRQVRNLVVHAGRFLDRDDVESRAKVCLVTEQLATALHGSSERAVGNAVAAHGMSFRIVGVFSERVATYGQSEVAEKSILVPHTVLRYFQPVERVDPLYVSVRSQERVEMAASIIRDTLAARHRPESQYRVDTLAGVLDTARQILLGLRTALVLVASVTLAISGIFVMNTVLISVSERTSEIGIRRAVGASRSDIRAQFLVEAVSIAALGGLGGTAIGTALIWGVSRAWPGLAVELPLGWVLGALLLAVIAGGLAGLLPAARASNLDPVEALRHE